MILVVSIVVIFILAPIETENNPLDEEEKRVFKRRTRIILCIEIVVFAVMIVIGKTQIAGTIALGLLTECLMLIIGYLNNHDLLRLKK